MQCKYIIEDIIISNNNNLLYGWDKWRTLIGRLISGPEKSFCPLKKFIKGN